MMGTINQLLRFTRTDGDPKGTTDTVQQAVLSTDERFRALIQHSADAIQLLSAGGKSSTQVISVN